MFRRKVFRVFLAFIAVLALAVMVAVAMGWQAFGRGAEGERRARMERSPQWKDGHFVNPQPMFNYFGLMVRGMLAISPDVSPVTPLPVVALERAQIEPPPSTGLRVTWFGHSTMLIEIDGFRVLTDPNWSERASPLSWIGPKRWYQSPIALESLPAIDAVLISHDHYDHLDYATITAMKDWDTQFFVPLGVGAHLEYWGVPPQHIAELDWWESAKIKDLEILCTPTRHASGRFIAQNSTLWGSFALLGPKHRAYFSGDTGLFPGLNDIGERYGPFDVTMIETGQYHAAWPDWHVGPEQAVIAHRMVRGRLLFPMHWGLLTLAYHAWTEPIERVLIAAKAQDVDVVAPKPGQSVEPELAPAIERWWPEVTWETAEQSPVVSSQMTP